MEWKKELEAFLEKGRSDSDIEDFCDAHPEVNGKDIWDYVYERSAPECCKRCKYIQMEGMFPCARCSRRVTTKDYYEPREET